MDFFPHCFKICWGIRKAISSCHSSKATMVTILGYLSNRSILWEFKNKSYPPSVFCRFTESKKWQLLLTQPSRISYHGTKIFSILHKIFPMLIKAQIWIKKHFTLTSLQAPFLNRFQAVILNLTNKAAEWSHLIPRGNEISQHSSQGVLVPHNPFSPVSHFTFLRCTIIFKLADLRLQTTLGKRFSE